MLILYEKKEMASLEVMKILICNGSVFSEVELD